MKGCGLDDGRERDMQRLLAAVSVEQVEKSISFEGVGAVQPGGSGVGTTGS